MKIKEFSIFSTFVLRVHELKTMFPVKSEPSDTFEVGKDSQRIRCIDDNPHISDTLNTDTSDIRPYKSLGEKMLLTVAYVKNERTSHAFDYNTSNSKGNECIHGQQLTDINVIKTEKIEAYSDNTLRDVSDVEHCTMHVKEESQHYHIKDQDIHHMTDISMHERIGESDAIDTGGLWSSNTARSRDEAHKYLQKKLFKCDKYSAKRSGDMKKHQLVHPGEKPYMCGECAYSTTQSGDLKTHRLVHSGEKPYKCDLCDYSTTTSGHLKRYKLTHSGVKPYKCDLCDYSTITSGNLKRHKLIHSGVKPYKCDECAYNTTTSGDLKTHKLIHSGEKPYKCDVCNYSTTTSGVLKTHKLIHSGERPHKCDLCDYSATQYGHMKRHKLIHTGEKPYRCNLCDYSSTESGALKRHKLIHTGEKPYKCDVCDYSATQSSNLKTHKLIHSQKKPSKSM